MRILERVLPPSFQKAHPLPPVLWSKMQSSLPQCTNCGRSCTFLHSEVDGAIICAHCHASAYQFVDSKAAHGSGYGNGINGGGGGTSSDYFRGHDHPSSNHGPNQNQREERFLAILQPFRDGSCESIIQEVHFEKILKRLHQDRIPIPEGITHSLLEQVLKSLGINMLYHQHINTLMRKLGVKLPYMSLEIYNLNRELFKSVEASWQRFDEDEHFINYNYLATQFNLLLHQHQFLPYFQIIRDDVKLAELENFYKQVCEQAGLKFVSLLELRLQGRLIR